MDITCSSWHLRFQFFKKSLAFTIRDLFAYKNCIAYKKKKFKYQPSGHDLKVLSCCRKYPKMSACKWQKLEWSKEGRQNISKIMTFHSMLAEKLLSQTEFCKAGLKRNRWSNAQNYDGNSSFFCPKLFCFHYINICIVQP